MHTTHTHTHSASECAKKEMKLKRHKTRISYKRNGNWFNSLLHWTSSLTESGAHTHTHAYAHLTKIQTTIRPCGQSRFEKSTNEAECVYELWRVCHGECETVTVKEEPYHIFNRGSITRIGPKTPISFDFHVLLHRMRSPRFNRFRLGAFLRSHCVERVLTF